jgi:hypothetical protein
MWIRRDISNANLIADSPSMTIIDFKEVAKGNVKMNERVNGDLGKDPELTKDGERSNVRLDGESERLTTQSNIVSGNTHSYVRIVESELGKQEDTTQ